MTEEREIGVSVKESIFNERMHLGSFNREMDMGSDSMYSKKEAVRLKIKLYIMAPRITERTDLLFESLAIASDTSFVVARLMPDVASVIAKEYTVEISVKSPIASAPIVLEIYTLKLTETARITKDTTVINNPFRINRFTLFMPSPFPCFLIKLYV